MMIPKRLYLIAAEGDDSAKKGKTPDKNYKVRVLP